MYKLSTNNKTKHSVCCLYNGIHLLLCTGIKRKGFGFVWGAGGTQILVSVAQRCGDNTSLTTTMNTTATGTIKTKIFYCCLTKQNRGFCFYIQTKKSTVFFIQCLINENEFILVVFY